MAYQFSVSWGNKKPRNFTLIGLNGCLQKFREQTGSQNVLQKWRAKQPKTTGSLQPLTVCCGCFKEKESWDTPYLHCRWEIWINQQYQFSLPAAFRADFRSDLLPYDKDVIICIKVFHFWLNYTTFFQWSESTGMGA